MSLWGPALEAEVEYRRTELKKAWGGRWPRGADGTERSEHRSGRRAGHRAERSVRKGRAEQIKEGMAGMRPASTARRGLFG